MAESKSEAFARPREERETELTEVVADTGDEENGATTEETSAETLPPATKKPAVAEEKDEFDKQVLDTPKHFRSSRKAQSVLEWKDVSFSVKERGKKKVILDSVSGSSASGAMLALMGFVDLLFIFLP